MPGDPTLALPVFEQVAPDSITDISGIIRGDSFVAGGSVELYPTPTALTATDSPGAGWCVFALGGSIAAAMLATPTVSPSARR